MISLEQIGQKAKQASENLAKAAAEDKNEALEKIAEELLIEQEKILIANQKDIERARKNNISPAVIDRIQLTKERIKGISDGLYQLTKLPDAIGQSLDEWKLESGIELRKVSVPIGVIGIIYEARPNVTVDAAALCLKAGNTVILR